MDPLNRLEAECRQLLSAARGADLATPTPWLGRWNVRDVVAHLGGVHRWADRVVGARSMDGPGFQKSKLDGPELLDWFEEGAEALVRTLRSAAPDDPCPNFNPGSDKTVGWWVRRQLHETTVHRWDLEAALGTAGAIDPESAADGVDEFFDTFVRTRGKQTATRPVVVTSSAPSRSWTVTLAAKPGRLDITPGAGKADATLVGPAPSLLLVLWGRIDLTDSDLVIEGDPTAIADFLGSS